MTVYALWHGGSSYATGSVEDDVEKFETLEDAVAACQSRKDQGNWSPQAFEYVSRPDDLVHTPMVDESSSMHIWMSNPLNVEDPYPDYMVEVMPGTDSFVVHIA